MLVTYPFIPDVGRNKVFRHKPDAVVSLVAKSVEHVELPRHFVDPSGHVFFVSLSPNSKPMTRLEIYEHENS